MPEQTRRAAAARDAETIHEVRCLRNEWMDALQRKGISTRPSTHAVHMLSYYQHKYGLKPEDFPNAWAANDCSISLPLFHGMTNAEQECVIYEVRQASFSNIRLL